MQRLAVFREEQFSIQCFPLTLTPLIWLLYRTVPSSYPLINASSDPVIIVLHQVVSEHPIV